MSERLLIAGGATGGHLFPGVAVAQRWSALGGEVLFAGVRHRLEAGLLRRYGYPLRTASVSGINGVGVRRGLRALGLLPLGLLQGMRIVLAYRPHVVLSLGGFAAAPVSVAALLLQRPLLVLETNVHPGLTNRLLARHAAAVAVAWDRTARRLPGAICTGTPVRDGLVHVLARPVRVDHTGRLKILVLGGSQGAGEIDDLMLRAAPQLAPRRGGILLRHLAATRNRGRLAAAYRRHGLEAEVSGFADDMGSLYRWADVAVSQAGASTCAELALAGLPALLVPFSRAAEDHQAFNAKAMARSGAALVQRRELAPDGLADLVADVAVDRRRLLEMARNARALARPRAAEAVVRLLRRSLPGG
jgi:UDP-N-acetylglucosamine--N-acetylmuramyl-(pentapeptide) pyrophosphoryl-undecaprenol N-acetylglucosamine transferase